MRPIEVDGFCRTISHASLEVVAATIVKLLATKTQCILVLIHPSVGIESCVLELKTETYCFADGARQIVFVLPMNLQISVIACHWEALLQRITGQRLVVFVHELDTDLAQPQSKDLLLRQSTRLFCAAPVAAQTCFDPQLLRAWLPNINYGGHAFGFRKRLPSAAWSVPGGTDRYPRVGSVEPF